MSKHRRTIARIWAGGVFLTLTGNSAIADLPGVRNLYVPSCPHDAGISVGAAFLGWARSTPGAVTARRVRGDFLGRPAEAITTGHAADHGYAPLTPPGDSGASATRAAEVLGHGAVVARYAGRAEFGPRALGNRSLLCHPVACVDARGKLNRLGKRQDWRPVAPMVREEDLSIYFLGPDESPFMNFNLHVRDEYRNLLVEALHPDGTARVQTVTMDDNPAIYSLLTAVAGHGQLPILINTSLNGPGQPIIDSAVDVLEFVQHPVVDYLLSDDCLFVTPASGPMPVWRPESVVMAMFGSGTTARYVLSNERSSSLVDRQLFLDLCEHGRALADRGSQLVLDCLSTGLLVTARRESHLLLRDRRSRVRRAVRGRGHARRDVAGHRRPRHLPLRPPGTAGSHRRAHSRALRPAGGHARLGTAPCRRLPPVGTRSRGLHGVGTGDLRPGEHRPGLRIDPDLRIHADPRAGRLRGQGAAQGVRQTGHRRVLGRRTRTLPHRPGPRRTRCLAHLRRGHSPRSLRPADAYSPHPRTGRRARGKRAPGRLPHTLRHGLRHNLDTPPLRIITIWAVSYNLGQCVIEALLLIALLEQTPITAVGYGVIRTCAVLFAVLGAYLAERLPTRLRSGLGTSVFGCGAVAAYAVVGIGAYLGGTTGLALVVAGFMLDEFCSGVALVRIQTLRARVIAQKNRAIATAAYRAVNLTAVPVGFALGGLAGLVLAPACHVRSTA